jgi:hypothetical protein
MTTDKTGQFMAKDLSMPDFKKPTKAQAETDEQYL